MRQVVEGSFRDPAGFVFQLDGRIHRHVAPEHRVHYDAMMERGLYRQLVDDGLMIPHDEVDTASPRPGAYKVLRPQMVGFVSYPFEWCFSQLKDAALLTLAIQRRAMSHGMSLRDASAYNVQFRQGRPVLIDSLSFELIREGSPWIGYAQFCRHFLAPLALVSYRDARLGTLSRTHLDGIPVDLAAALLPSRTRLRPGLLAHIHAQAKISRRHAARDTAPRAPRRTMSLKKLEALVWNLERTVRKLEWRDPVSPWLRYHDAATQYPDATFERKRDIVRRLLEEAGGKSVWDLGSNVGLLARDAAALGRDVVCFDLDPACVEANYRSVRADREENVLPLVCDLRNPSPSIGWAGRERLSLTERGPADVVMALALVHHLAIGNNLPLRMVADHFSELGSSLIVEFCPKSDPRVRLLLAQRDDVFPGYDRAGFEDAFSTRYSIVRRLEVEGTERTIYLMHCLAGDRAAR